MSPLERWQAPPLLSRNIAPRRKNAGKLASFTSLSCHDLVTARRTSTNQHARSQKVSNNSTGLC